MNGTPSSVTGRISVVAGTPSSVDGTPSSVANRISVVAGT